MGRFTFFPDDQKNQQWLLKVIISFLVFLLLAWLAWLYFDWRLQLLLKCRPPGQGLGAISFTWFKTFSPVKFGLYPF